MLGGRLHTLARSMGPGTCCCTRLLAKRMILPATSAWVAMPKGLATGAKPKSKSNNANLAARIEYKLRQKKVATDGVDLENIVQLILGKRVAGKQIRAALINNPELLQNDFDSWNQAVEMLQDSGFKNEQILQVIVGHPVILSGKVKKLSDVMDTLRSIGFSDEELTDMISSHPAIVMSDHGRIWQNFTSLLKLYPRHWCKNACYRHPAVLTEEFSIVEERLAYCFETMGADVKETLKASAFAYSVQHIRCRHEFLERSGLFEKPDKHGVTANLNPSLSSVLEETDEHFSKEVAKMNLAEYKAFSRMLELEPTVDDDLSRAVDDDDDDGGEGL